MSTFDVLFHRIQTGCETIAYPDGPAPALPDRHGGALQLDSTRCMDTCHACMDICPTQAIRRTQENGIELDLGRCLFCGSCVEVCPTQAITHTNNHRMAVRKKDDLILGTGARSQLRLAEDLGSRLIALLGRSIRLRQVSAGGCNACEADVNVLGTIGWDLGRFGIQFVASPRHADGILITGPVSKAMELALRKTWDAIPEPKIAIAVGACAISGGPFHANPETHAGADGIIPIDLYIPGCPPHPLTILDGLLRVLGKLKNSASEHAE